MKVIESNYNEELQQMERPKKGGTRL